MRVQMDSMSPKPEANTAAKFSEKELSKSSLLNFSDFYDIKFAKDGVGEVYPEIWDEISKPEPIKKKKGGTKKGIEKGGMEEVPGKEGTTPASGEEMPL